MSKKLVFFLIIIILGEYTFAFPSIIARIIKSVAKINIEDRPYHFRYVTKYGITREETGTIRVSKNNVSYVAVQGYYRYMAGDENNTYFVYYEADEDGYREEYYGLAMLRTLSVGALGSLIGGGRG